MKRLFLFLMLPLLAITLNSCSKKDDGGNVDFNKFTINGKAYETIHGGYWHQPYNGMTAIDISLETKEGVCIDFEMFAPSGNTKLIAGTYKYNDNQTTFTFSDSELYDDNIGFQKTITGGTVAVAISGDTYTLTVNCSLEQGGTLHGTYKGTLTAKN